MRSITVASLLALLAAIAWISTSTPAQVTKPATAATSSTTATAPMPTTSVHAVAPVATAPGGRLDMKYSLEVPIPHTPWGKPYAQGKLKAWILSPIVPTGDTVSLLHRFDFDCDIVSCDMSWEMNTWGIGDFYRGRSNKDKKGRPLELGYATADLTSDKHYDVLIIPTVIGWNAYPKEMREAIVKRVKAGAGLVMIAPQDCKEQPADEIALTVLSPISGSTPIEYHWYGDWDRRYGRKDPVAWTIARDQHRHPILNGVCWDAMPFATAVPIHDFKKVAPGATLLASAGDIPTIAVQTVGKGRVVAINWFAGRHNSGLTPGEDASKCPTWDYWEQFYNILGRSALWAAGREPKVDVGIRPLADAKAFVDLDNRGDAQDVKLRAIVKDHRGRIISDKSHDARMPQGISKVEIPLGRIPGGTAHVEVIAIGKAGHLGWGAAQTGGAKVANITAVTVTPEAVKNAQEVSGKVILDGKDFRGGLRLQLRDPYGRVLAETTKHVSVNSSPLAATAPSEDYSFKVENALSQVVFVRAILEHLPQPKSPSPPGTDEPMPPIAEKDSADVIITPDRPHFSDYEVIPWGFTARRDLWDVRAAQYRKFFATASDTMTLQSNRAGFIVKGRAEAQAGVLGVYWFDPERENLQKIWEQYKKDRDKSKLVRSKCLSDPEVLKKAEEDLRSKVRANRKYNPGVYFIGDESSVTAYKEEIDLDFCPKAIEDFRGWLKGRYETIEKLNTKWQTKYEGFDKIEPFTILEVEEDATKACGWAEHRLFMEERYEGLLAMLARAGKEEDANAQFELVGTQSATPFNGINWARHTRHIKRFVPYNINFAYDQFRSFHDDVRMSALTGYGSSGPGVKLSLWNQAMHGMLSANIFWQWSLVNPDLTLSQNAKDIGEVFGELRGRGIGRLIGTARWVRSPVAIYYSQPSIYAARIQKREDVCHNSRNSWCQAVRDVGLQFDLLSYFQVEEGKWLENPPQVLVMPAVLAVSAREAANITKYVEAGGTVIADIQPGICDERCDIRENKLLANLFPDGKAGERTVGKGKVILLGAEIGDYYVRDKARTEARHAQVRKIVADALAQAPATATVPVTAAGQPLSYSETVVMANGPWKLVGILKENVAGIRRTSADGVEYFEPLPPGQAPQPEKISVKLPEKSFVYDVRAGKYLGHLETIEDDLRPAETKLYSLLPYQVKGMTLKADGKFDPGAVLKVSVALEMGDGLTGYHADGKPRVGQHVFNVRAVDADGNDIHYYARNVVSDNGKVTLSFPVELNPKGPFKVIVTDVLTGHRASHEFK